MHRLQRFLGTQSCSVAQAGHVHCGGFGFGPTTASRCAVLRRRLSFVTRWVIGGVIRRLARFVDLMIRRAGFITVVRVGRPVVLFGTEVVAARGAVLLGASAPRAPVASPLGARCGTLSAFGALAHRWCFGAPALRHVVAGALVLGLAVVIHGAQRTLDAVTFRSRRGKGIAEVDGGIRVPLAWFLRLAARRLWGPLFRCALTAR